MQHVLAEVFNKKLIIVSKNKFVVALCFETDSNYKYYLDNSIENSHSELLNLAKKQLLEFLGNKTTTFNINLKLNGTEFQKLVWSQLTMIPYGQTKSYSEVATNIGRPNAFRAVANAIGNNPICIIIPCHRVIRSSGELGGYSGGSEIKKRLLSSEVR